MDCYVSGYLKFMGKMSDPKARAKFLNVQPKTYKGTDDVKQFVKSLPVVADSIKGLVRTDKIYLHLGKFSKAPPEFTPGRKYGITKSLARYRQPEVVEVSEFKMEANDEQ